MRKLRIIHYIVASLLLVGVCGLLNSQQALADTTDSSVYGAGDYGDCGYGSCAITLTSGGETTIDVIPSASGKCTINSDVTSVLTDAPNGYTLTMTTNTTNNSLAGGSASISASSGTSSSPTTLATNTWGYRVDGLDGFGAGPTSAQTNANPPSLTFAGVPPSNQPGTRIASTTSPANPAEDTTVWYGVCSDASIPSDTYSTTILYTAVVN